MRLLIGLMLSFVALVPFAVLARDLTLLEALTIPLGALITISVLLANVWAQGRARS
jgi:hypothetical protein